MIRINIFTLISLLTVFWISFSPVSAVANPIQISALLPRSENRALMPITDQLQSLIGITPAPSSPPGPTNKGDDTEESTTEPQETFGVRALNLLINDFDVLCSQSKNLATNFTAGTDLSTWLDYQTADQRHIDRWHSISQDVLIVIGIPFLIALVSDFALTPLRRLLIRRRPQFLSQRLLVLLGLITVKILPVILFVGSSLTLLDHFETQKLQRFVILNIIYAMTLNRLVIALIRISLTPKSETLRLIPVSTAQAESTYRWMSSLSFVIIYGYFFTDVARAIYIPASAILVFNHLVGLVVVIMAIAMILQKKAALASALRGSLAAKQPNLSMLQSLRLWFARRWHVLAIAYLIVGFGMTLLDVQNGYNLMLRGTVLTALILVVLRFLLLGLERSIKTDASKKIPLHRIFLIFILRCILWITAVLAIAASWGADLVAFFVTPLGQRLLGASFSIGVTIGLTALLYEGLHVASERQLNRRDAEGKPVPASARMRTLLPMLRNTALIFFAAIIGLVSLSEAGINIAPLLAGAGVVGVAIGFGSQTLVKDFLTGLFIIVENTIAIGDVVKIGDHAGTVEAMSLRTLRLRDNDGAMHILPFSEVSQIINMTKDFAFAVIDIGVSYTADLDHVMAVMRSVGDALQQDPIFKRVILEPIEILGIEKLGDSSIILRARLRTRAGKQWDVKRILLLKMKQRFDKEGIEIPYPIVTQLHKA